MTKDLDLRMKEAFEELERTYDMMEAADMDTKSTRKWLRKWLEIKDMQAAND